MSIKSGQSYIVSASDHYTCITKVILSVESCTHCIMKDYTNIHFRICIIVNLWN